MALAKRAIRCGWDVIAIVRDRESAARAVGSDEAGAPLAEARTQLEAWQSRALAAEAQLLDLEQRLAAADMAVLELRSRNVCLNGKLAASSATKRYQSMMLKLDGSASAPTLPFATPSGTP